MFVPEALLGSGPLAVILDGGYGTAFLVVLLAVKLCLTALCIGFGLLGGVFAGAVRRRAAGAVAGRLVAMLSGAGNGAGFRWHFHLRHGR